jgi:hypothetical protein
MSKIECTCKNCNKVFIGDTRETNRGNAKFCSMSCFASYRNNHLFQFETVCKHCGGRYNTSSKQSKYCSTSCKLKTYRLLKKSDNKYDRILIRELQRYSCEICQFNDCPRDVHHILPVSKGGKDVLDNLITLCPNHHRMVHCNMISHDHLLEIIESRIISTSLQLLINKINNNVNKFV